MAESIEGVDFSAHSPGEPGGQALVNDGISFVCTYLQTEDDWRVLSVDDALDIMAHRINLVANYEENIRTWAGGFAVGVRHAKEAEVGRRRIGLPDRQPIYFSVDDDVSEGDQPAINDYFRGVASVIGLDRTGIYGGYWAVKRAWEAGVVKWIWQTYAWSGNEADPFQRLIHPETHIYQYNIYNQSIAGVDVDLNVALKEHYGGHRDFLATPVPPPPAPPAPPAQPFPTHRIAAPDKIEAQHHKLVVNNFPRFRAIQGGHFRTAPDRTAPNATPSPYKAGKVYTFGFRAQVDKDDWLVSKNGSWAERKNFEPEQA